MSPASAAVQEPPPENSLPASESRSGEAVLPPKPSRRTLERSLRNATDDEILGLVPVRKVIPNAQDGPSSNSDGDVDARGSSSPPGETESSPKDSADAQAGISSEVRAALDANPELRTAWQDAQAYRETFATPEEANAATALVADMNRLDALFFSRRPEDHAELARSIAELDPAAFASLAQAISRQAAAIVAPVGAGLRPAPTAENSRNAATTGATTAATTAAPGPSPAQTDFFHATNAAAVEGVLSAIESQVERLLPEGVSKSARSRVVGEIYRELDTTLRSNRQLSQQMREAFRSGALDADHRHAIVSLVTGRARQALPAVAKRVLNEWTSAIVAANQDRRTRQRTAERRVDIVGTSSSASDGRRGTSPRHINYSRMSDADILNM
jgi:hypothetical protein